VDLIKHRKSFRGRFRREERHRINGRVRAPEVRLIGEDGKLIGLMSSFEAFNLAKDRGLDLVEIHEKSSPPICKIMDYGKWKFETKKKEKQNKKNQTKILIKEIQLRPRTDEGDIKIKLDKAREFLKQGHKVKINLRFFGREMAHKELGFNLLKKVETRLSDLAVPEMPAKMERRTLFTIVAPHTGGGSSSKKNSSHPGASNPKLETLKSSSHGTSHSKLGSKKNISKEEAQKSHQISHSPHHKVESSGFFSNKDEKISNN